MAMIMNVTPQEHSYILEATQLPPNEFLWRMVTKFGRTILFEEIQICVRRDVPSVPWFSQGVLRYERLERTAK